MTARGSNNEESGVRRCSTKAGTRTRQGPPKHTTYFEVLDATAAGGCPICRLARRAVSRFLAALSYENVNDPFVRAELRAARGFCNQHAWQFAKETCDGLGAAIIYRDILSAVLQALERPLATGVGPGFLSKVATFLSRRGGNSLAQRVLPQAACPACRTLAESSRRYVDTLVIYLADGGLHDRYLDADGLCLPHLRAALVQVERHSEFELLADVFARSIGTRFAALVSNRQTEAAPLVAAIVGQPGAVQHAPLPADRTSETISPAGSADLALLQEVFGAGDCPLCQQVIAATDLYLSVLPDQIDCRPELSQEFVTALGLCNAHAWRLMTLASPARTTIVWQPVIVAVQDLLGTREDIVSLYAYHRGISSARESPGARPIGSLIAARLRARAPCPACRLHDAAARSWATALLAGLRRADFFAAFQHSACLCLPHFALSYRLAADGQQRQILRAGQADFFHALRSQLDEYVRKQDYRFRAEPWGAEIDSPWRAIAHVAGAKGLCSGPDH